MSDGFCTFLVKSKMDTSNFEQEEQFILRVPAEDAQTIREILNSKRDKSKKLLKLDLDIGNNSGLVFLGTKVLEGTFKKLPTIVESYKTNMNGNKSNLFKTADISHILDCTDEPEVDENVKPKGVSKKKKKKGNLDEDKTKEAADGLTPPMKSARRRRFRKTLYNQDTAYEVDSITKELYYLISTDMEAVSTRFEVIYENGPNNNTSKQPLQVKDLFGEISSDEPEEEV